MYCTIFVFGIWRVDAVVMVMVTVKTRKQMEKTNVEDATSSD
jgi:hypothetical protein